MKTALLLLLISLAANLPSLLRAFPSAASENSHYQLYNLADDPFEQKNLATSNPDELHRMMRKMIAALEEHDAVYPVDKDGAAALKPKLP